jgi:hypothetical protein
VSNASEPVVQSFVPRPFRSFRGVGLAAAAAALVAMQTGCAVVSPTPTLELLKAAGSATVYAISSGPSSASNTVYHPHTTFDSVCIEYNRNSQVADIVPAIQQELRTHRIESRVYEDGTPPQVCPVWLRYHAYLDYAKPPFSDADKPYLKNASLALMATDGKVLSTSEYQVVGFMEMGKWAPTRSKMAPVVTALVTGFEK